ncbi:TIGR00730 family Rossman fold protein [Fuscovulum ytuae]|uniref:Cytokinin riboside 5'-monophosphate phosphoribohydrolase n=1 Tax=Fuscovulum ytuae TaxID=3042299 RepID=A0ABY8Q443_9RHOB|nr:TIGR00730 family Rossman fold protein [Fuscovulum sp. YMD61]WGV15609.1 TIGR00730 family Rossman fold protein [Fuscovulum sp. YMD61]
MTPKEDGRSHPFRDSSEDAAAAERLPDTAQTQAPAYRLAFTDTDFLMREELRPVRLQLELLKPQMVLDERGIRSTVVVMGSARVRPDGTGPAGGLARWYEEARKLSFLITEESLKSYGRELVVVTGGGPGIMEAGNLGAAEAGGQSIGLNIVLPHEQAPNAHVTPDLCFNFHYFAIRKMHFLMRARAVCIFPGGFGTLDEMFEALTLIQTGRMKPVPFLLFGRAFWEGVVNWQALADQGLINADDLKLFRFVETAEEAVEMILGGA